MLDVIMTCVMWLSLSLFLFPLLMEYFLNLNGFSIIIFFFKVFNSYINPLAQYNQKLLVKLQTSKFLLHL